MAFGPFEWGTSYLLYSRPPLSFLSPGSCLKSGFLSARKKKKIWCWILKPFPPPFGQRLFVALVQDECFPARAFPPPGPPSSSFSFFGAPVSRLCFERGRHDAKNFSPLQEEKILESSNHPAPSAYFPQRLFLALPQHEGFQLDPFPSFPLVVLVLLWRRRLWQESHRNQIRQVPAHNLHSYRTST